MIKCDRCGETVLNIYCRCACQREPQTQSERIVELEAENAKLLAFKNTCITDVELLELQRLREALKVIASCGATMTIGEMREHALAALEIGDE
jgi:hypothetical protein